MNTMTRHFGRLLLISTILLIIAPSPAGQVMNILVFPFKNGGSPQHSWLSIGMTDTVVADLLRLRSVNVFSEEERKKAVEEIGLHMSGIIKEEDIIPAGEVMGADLIFTGSYTVVSGKVRIVSKLVDVATTKLLKSGKLDGTMEGIFDLQDQIVATLMEEAEQVQIKEKATPKFTEQEKNDVKKGHVPPVKAFELYSRALEKVEIDPAKALNFALEALKIDPRYPAALNITAYAYTEMGDPAKADPYYAMAKKELVDSDMKTTADYANLLLTMSVNDHYRGEYNRSLELARESKELWEQLGKKETPLYAATLITMGINYLGLGAQSQNALNKAIQYLSDAKELLERIGLRKSNLYGFTMLDMGVYYSSIKDYGKAMSFLQDTMKLYESMGLQKKAYNYGLALVNIGSVYYNKGDYANSLAKSKEAMTQFENLGIQKSRHYAYASYGAASAYWGMKRYCDGVLYVEKASNIMTAIGHKDAAWFKNALQTFRSQCGK